MMMSFVVTLPLDVRRHRRHVAERRRGVDIEVKVATRRPSLKFDILRELEQELRNMSSKKGADDCPGCESEENKSPFASEESRNSFSPKRIKLRGRALQMRPAYPCDEWDEKRRICWLDRNVGDTVTFVISFANGSSEPPRVQWRQEFHIFHSKKRRHFVINQANPLWNIVIGSRGHEMRLSPVTEMDIDDNSFSAHVFHDKLPHLPDILNRVNFRIRAMPVDMGFVYPGETLTLNMRRVSLPPSSMIFEWYLEGESGTSLPSNMKLSPSGGVLTISELRKEQEGILACAVFTNKGFFATKQRFLIKEMNQGDNMLLFVPTRPTPVSTLSRRRRQSADSVDRALEENQRMASRLQTIDNQSPADDPYAIQNVDLYREAEADEPLRHSSREGMQPSHVHVHDNDDETVLEVARKPALPYIRSQDTLSKMISWCNNSSQCAIDADCVLKNSHFCRCKSGFQGNGIFCWEDLKARNVAIFEELETTQHIFYDTPSIDTLSA